MSDVKKEYTNGEITVVWKPGLCIHSEICVKTLPNVYDPKAKPWITPENASSEDLKAQINQCPSGALTYYMNADGPKPIEPETSTSVQVLANGPLVVHGTIKVVHADGREEIKPNRVSLCRCGASANKPFCDGKHKTINFEG